jgi:hypothetical protein
MFHGRGKHVKIRGWRMPVILLGAIAIAAGCARTGLPWNHPQADLATAAADTAAYFPDTSAVVDTRYEPDFAEEVTTIVETPVVRRETPAPSVNVAPPPAPAPDTTASEPAVPPPTISMAIPEAQRIRLTNAYRLDAAAADSLRAELGPQVNSASGKEKLQTAADLLAQARAAMEAQNLEAAANLAHKARLLVQELLPR